MSNILIKEKDESVSWDDVKSVIVAAHQVNFAKGIVMRYPSLPADEIAKKISDGNGKMIVALDGDKVVGVSAYMIKKGKTWYCKECYMYLCFTGMLPEYSGRGIYKGLNEFIEEERKRLDLQIVMFDTHEKNKRIMDVNKRGGFKEVDYKRYGDHCNIVLVRWVKECPFSNLYIRYRFIRKFLLVKLKMMFR